jgi:hypothetical protein
VQSFVLHIISFFHVSMGQQHLYLDRMAQGNKFGDDAIHISPFHKLRSSDPM